MTGRTPPGGAPLTPATAIRIAALGLAALVLLGVLVTRLWFLQVIGGQAYANQADQNRVRTVDLPAKRGTIIDRNGVVLARVREGWNLVARPLELRNPARQDVIRRLAAAMGEKPRPMLKGLALAQKGAPFEAVVLVEDVPLGKRVAFAEHQRDFPGVSLEKAYVRTYPEGSTAAHVLGYTGPIFKEDFQKYRDQGYVGNEIVGKAGLEFQYESYLRGTKGQQTIEVDATGRPVGGGVFNTVAPTPGNTLQLSIDLPTQRALEDQLRARVDGSTAPGAAGVALDPQTGEVLAIASYPTFNPEDYVRARVKKTDAYARDTEGKPLFPRFMNSYPPGSTFKPVTLAGALEEKLKDVTPDAMLPSPPCIELYGIKKCNFEKEEQGVLSLPRALEMSSDTIFYAIGNKFWHRYQKTGAEVQQQWAHKFDMGRRTGIDLPGESPGVVPDKAWVADYPFADNRSRIWKPGYNIDMAIGQGDMQATPLQMAVAFAAVANGGNVVTPTLGQRIETPAGSLVRQLAGAHPARSLNLKPTTLQVLREGLVLAANGPRGTSTPIFAPVFAAGGPLIAGKTGTAESNLPDTDHSWYVGYGPANPGKRPKIVVAIMVEYGGTGASQAAPAVCATMAPYLDYSPSACGVPTARKVD